LGLRTPAELTVDSLDHVRRAERLPLALGEAGEGQQFLAGLFETRGNLRQKLAPLAEEGVVRLVSERGTLGVGDGTVVALQFLLAVLGRLGQQVLQFVVRASLDEHVRPGLPDRAAQSLVPVEHD